MDSATGRAAPCKARVEAWERLSREDKRITTPVAIPCLLPIEGGCGAAAGVDCNAGAAADPAALGRAATTGGMSPDAPQPGAAASPPPGPLLSAARFARIVDRAKAAEAPCTCRDGYDTCPRCDVALRLAADVPALLAHAQAHGIETQAAEIWALRAELAAAVTLAAAERALRVAFEEWHERPIGRNAVAVAVAEARTALLAAGGTP